MTEIGHIAFVQVQRSSLKLGERPNRYYDPSPLLKVPAMLLTPHGAIGLESGGARTVDVHNADHPKTKNKNLENCLSIGFTSHYEAMRKKFGARVYDGCAGENVVVEVHRQIRLDDLGDTLRIESNDGEILLSNVMVAAPCLEFTRWVHPPETQPTGEDLRATVQFLNHGMRGFYARFAEGQMDAEIRAGDRIFKVS